VTQLASHSPRRARRDPDPRTSSTRPPSMQLPPPRRPGRRPRGRHSTSLGQGFSWVVFWSILGTLVPGSGLMAAGKRAAGVVVLGVAVLTISILAGFSMLTDPVAAALRLAVSPTMLLYAIAAVGLVALLWVILVIVTHVNLRRLAVLTGGQEALCAALVVALIGAVLLPAVKLGSYALIQRDLVSSVFSASAPGHGSRPNLSKPDPWATIPRVNVLLIGSDAGADRAGVRPDTLILASVNTHTGDTVMFSLPRNLERVPFPIGTPGAQAWPDGFHCAADACLLNAIWRWAEGAGPSPNGRQFYTGSNPGLTATEDAVQGITGLKVDYYAMLNLAGFSQFVDAMGGITVNVRERLPIGGSGDPSRRDYHVATGGWIEKGVKHLDGYHALWYARSRWTTDDYDRMRRQRCVIGAIVQKANPSKLAEAFPALASAAKHNIGTNLPRNDLGAWVDLTLRVKRNGSVRSLPFTPQVTGGSIDPNYTKIRRLVQAALVPPPEPTPTVTASGSPALGATATPTSPAKPSPSPTLNASEAQNVTDVC
jgi:polyisoprenyl-teichoic acid--peptidoglycan teichoic acid transferase